MSTARTQTTDARCINAKRGMPRRGKRQGAKRVREMLRRDLASRVAELDEPPLQRELSEKMAKNTPVCEKRPRKMGVVLL